MLHNPALRMVGRRLAAALPGLVGVVIVTFLLTRALPGDPAAFNLLGDGLRDLIDPRRRT